MGWGGTVRRILAAGAVVVLATGCGSASDPSPPAGVDQLVIPTPSPEPDDFVATVDNPWLPLAPGASWTYESVDDPALGLAVTVTDGPTVAGVPTTAVRSVTSSSDAGEAADHIDYYAQDTDGNVWWFGREGEWAAGEDGAEAGIAMLARPRFGDGYAEMGVDDEAGQRSKIVVLDDDRLVIETTSALGGDVVANHYERGTGLILRDLGTDKVLELVTIDEPQH